jgi:2'-5' RNA ligase
VTVLYPFLASRAIDASVVTQLASLLRAYSPFSFRMTGVAFFPGVTYLTVDPAHRFNQLTHAIWRRWDRCPPYGGRYQTLVPHVTVCEGDVPPGALEALTEMLPVEAAATEVALLVQDRRGSWTVRAQFPLLGRA